MKFTINIKDSKVAAFIELLKNFDFIDIEDSEDFHDLEGVVLAEDIKEILEEKLAVYRQAPNQVLEWIDVKKELV